MKKIFEIILTVGLLVTAAHSTSRASETPKTYKLLTANVGNADILFCGADYMYKLCRFSEEKRIIAGIAKINPDIVALQEVYDVSWCEKKPPEKNKTKVCRDYDKITPRDQVRRLLGDQYTIVCDGRSNYECVGLKKTVGKIENCPDGELCKGPNAAITLPEPEGCEPYPVVFGVNFIIGGKTIRMVNAHPAASQAKCRKGDISNLFGNAADTGPLADPKLNVLTMGDFNTDPFHGTDDEAADILRDNVGPGKTFYYLSGPAEHDPPFTTSVNRTIDHVFTNFANGKCKTLGRDKDNPRLDGSVGEPRTEGTDHSPVLCEITLGD